MIKVYKDFDDIPKILKSSNRKEAFDKNILDSNYVDSKHRYKVGSVQKRLVEIYNLKCAYCEKSLLDAPKHIEHYRPKSIYYWLPYSWDNLLLCCGECNSSKGVKFPILNSMVQYKNETFEDINNLGNGYDKIEEPQIINPERDDILHFIKFDRSGIMFSDEPRVDKTIMICKLNRKELVQRRLVILTDLSQEMDAHLLYFIAKKDTSRFIPTIQKFIEKLNTQNEFYAFRYFILNNTNIVSDNKFIIKILDRILKKTIPNP